MWGLLAAMPTPLIAIVDADASVRQSTRRLLLALGFEAEAFASAAEFLASNAVERAGCLLLDVRMPGMDGLDLQRQLARAGRRTPIVFLTARASEEEEDEARRAGAVEILRKPAAKDDLLRALQAALARAADAADA